MTVQSGMKMGSSDVVVVGGAGLAGGMMALLLAQKGERVQVVEKRGDIRKETNMMHHQAEGSQMGNLSSTSKRSINLALSYRGICALKESGLFERVQPLLIPMKGRMMHALNGSVKFLPYGTGDQAICSVSRLELNAFLLNELEQMPNVDIRYNTRIERLTPSAKVYLRTNEGALETVQAKAVVGADGAFSSVRDSLMKTSRMDFRQEIFFNGYKEFTIEATEDGDFALPNHESLHVWPRSTFMFIALPNVDRTFTCTLFAPWKGPNSFESLQTDASIFEFFNKNFPDVVPLMPDLLQQFRTNPASALLSMVCNPWNAGKVVLIGDAAHAAVPFYGQGMNAAFEDALLLTDIWKESNDKPVEEVFDMFSVQRQPAGAALGQLSLDNYAVMNSLSARTWFIWKKKLERLLHAVAPSVWVPLYAMVGFSRVPYHKAVARARSQDRILGLVLLFGFSSVATALALRFIQHLRWSCSPR